MSDEYSSVVAPYISGLIATKRASGYTYETAEFYLYDFDGYCSLHAKCKSLSRELVRGWAKAKDGENPGTHRTRISPIRELGKYMQSLGVSDAFVLPSNLSRKVERHVPHFFTTQELAAFFMACDNLKPHGAVHARHLVLPVFFRLLYCCGLRRPARQGRYELRMLTFKTDKLISLCPRVSGAAESHYRRIFWNFSGHMMCVCQKYIPVESISFRQQDQNATTVQT